jgi:hypothetical protein
VAVVLGFKPLDMIRQELYAAAFSPVTSMTSRPTSSPR